MASRRRSIAVLSLVAALGSCTALRARAERDPATLTPGDPLLVVPPFTADSNAAIVWRLRSAPGSVEEEVTRNRTYRLRISRLEVLITEWMAPYSSLDSLFIDRLTLAPVRETLVNGRDRYSYDFDSGRVGGLIEKPDSQPVRVTRQFGRPIFAFNEVERLVTALPFRRGLNLTVPLFSEVDAAVEIDTLTVIGRVPSRVQPLWRIRFADPAITAEYLVDERSRTVREYSSRNRKSGTVFRVTAPH